MAIRTVELHLTHSAPGKPPSGSMYCREGALLRRAQLTTQVRMSYTCSSGVEVQETRMLRYINRGSGRDIYGDDDPHDGRELVVKLQEMQYHDRSNKAEYEAINKWRRYLGEGLPQTHWCGIARMYNVVGTFVSDLSCLVMSAAGQDLMCHLGSIEVAQGVSRFQKLRNTLSVFRSYVCFFKHAWDCGAFVDDYGLDQVCVRVGVSPMQQLEVDHLVLVDAEGLKEKAGARKIGKRWKRVWMELEARLGQQNYQLPPSELHTLQFLMNRPNMECGEYVVETVNNAFRNILAVNWSLLETAGAGHFAFSTECLCKNMRCGQVWVHAARCIHDWQVELSKQYQGPRASGSSATTGNCSITDIGGCGAECSLACPLFT